MGNLCPSFSAKFWPNDVVVVSSNLPKPPNFSEVADDVDADVTPLAPRILMINDVDVLRKHNGDHHKTSLFSVMQDEKNKHALVVRRGQPFSLRLITNRRYNPKQDYISFILTVSDVPKPTYGHGTLAAVPLLPACAPGFETNNNWTACLESTDDSGMDVKLTPPADCVVAKWRLEIDMKLTSNAVSYTLPTEIYILFNPWCVQDSVYLESEDERHEYVLETSGLIWRGSYNRLRPVPWVFAQFEKDVLDCSLYVIHKVGGVTGPGRACPIRSTRALSAAVNSPDDNGVVFGCWDEDFGKHTAPTKWVGSMKILQEFYKTKKPVKYGQCWVFAGVLATICRAVGIPCRVVTCYSAAHDTQGSLTVDYFVDKEGKLMKEYTEDSVWNYHVWNEVWMDRPDLGIDYGGWQVVDATPQELSDNMFRCGPSSVAAVKMGQVLRPYDNSFVFAEVDADKVFWKYSGLTQPLKLLSKDATGIGKLLCTKAIGKMDKQDITSTYKYPEKSREERSAMLRALQQTEHIFARYYLNEDFNDVKFDLQLNDDIKIGKGFQVELKVFNRNLDKDYKVNVIIRVESVTYTGSQRTLVKRNEVEGLVTAANEEIFTLDVTYEDYGDKLCSQCSFNVACLATVLETNYEYFAQDDFRVRKPDIKMKLHEDPEELKPCTVDISLENPLPVELKKCYFIVEGPGLENGLVLKVKGRVEAFSGVAKAQFTFVPPRTGRHTLSAKFVSKQLDDVDGFVRFMVLPNKEYNAMMQGQS